MEKTIEYISNLIGKDKVQEKIKSGLWGVVLLKLDQLEEWEREWGRDVLKEKLERYNLQYLLELSGGQCVGAF